MAANRKGQDNPDGRRNRALRNSRRQVETEGLGTYMCTFKRGTRRREEEGQ